MMEDEVTSSNWYEEELSIDKKKRKLLFCTVDAVFAAVIALLVVILIIELTRSFTSVNPPTVDDDEYFYKSMSLDDILGFLQKFSVIAATDPSNSRSVTNGYNASVAYVRSVLTQNTDYFLWEQPFTITEVSFSDNSSFSQTNPVTKPYSLGTEYTIIENSPSGDVTALVESDILNFGCNPEDYVNVLQGTIMMIPAGGNCTLNDKILLAEAAKAIGVLFINDISQSVPVTGELDDNTTATIPALGISYLLGNNIYEATVHIYVLSVETVTYTMNLFADTRGGDANSLIVVGSHLDSVPAGPGINDNGSGSAVNLELAIQMYNKSISNQSKIRFAWWGAEELGLLGSKYYVSSLSPSDLQATVLNLNFDMLASPNFIRGIYDGSQAEEPITAACTKIASLFEEFFTMIGVPYVLTPFNGRSDYGPFLDANIPAGGLKTGSNEIKTVEQRATLGGFANATCDPCYHKYCDDYGNINIEILAENAQAAAYVLELLAIQPDLRSYLGQS